MGGSRDTFVRAILWDSWKSCLPSLHNRSERCFHQNKGLSPIGVEASTSDSMRNSQSIARTFPKHLESIAHEDLGVLGKGLARHGIPVSPSIVALYLCSIVNA